MAYFKSGYLLSAAQLQSFLKKTLINSWYPNRSPHERKTQLLTASCCYKLQNLFVSWYLWVENKLRIRFRPSGVWISDRQSAAVRERKMWNILPACCWGCFSSSTPSDSRFQMLFGFKRRNRLTWRRHGSCQLSSFASDVIPDLWPRARLSSDPIWLCNTEPSIFKEKEA